MVAASAAAASASSEWDDLGQRRLINSARSFGRSRSLVARFLSDADRPYTPSRAVVYVCDFARRTLMRTACVRARARAALNYCVALNAFETELSARDENTCRTPLDVVWFCHWLASQSSMAGQSLAHVHMLSWQGDC